MKSLSFPPAPQFGLPIIGVGGYKTSGKDEFARGLVDGLDYHSRGMSDILDEFLLKQDPFILIRKGEPGWDHPSAAFDSSGHVILPYTLVRAEVSYTEAKKIRDVRRLLQSTGTDAGRTLIHEDVWVSKAIRSAGAIATENRADGYATVITGIRYPNELEMIHEFGGVAVWIDRPIITALHEQALASQDPLAQHSSEVTLGADDFDIVLTNDGTINDLHRLALATALGLFRGEQTHIVIEGTGTHQDGLWVARESISFPNEDWDGHTGLVLGSKVEMEPTKRFRLNKSGEAGQVYIPARVGESGVPQA